MAGAIVPAGGLAGLLAGLPAAPPPVGMPPAFPPMPGGPPPAGMGAGGAAAPAGPGGLPGAVWPLPGGGGGAVLDAWLDSAIEGVVLGSPLICPGLVVQLVTRNAMCAVDGSLYMVIARADTPADNAGRFLECRFAGSSEPVHGPIMEALFPSPAAAGYAYGVLHLCTQQAGNCTARLANRQVVHANQFRLRRASTVVDPWKRDLYALGASPDAPALPGVPVAGWTLPPPPGDATPGGADAGSEGWDLSALDMSSSNDDDASTSKKSKRKADATGSGNVRRTRRK